MNLKVFSFCYAILGIPFFYGTLALFVYQIIIPLVQVSSSLSSFHYLSLHEVVESNNIFNRTILIDSYPSNMRKNLI